MCINMLLFLDVLSTRTSHIILMCYKPLAKYEKNFYLYECYCVLWKIWKFYQRLYSNKCFLTTLLTCSKVFIYSIYWEGCNLEADISTHFFIKVPCSETIDSQHIYFIIQVFKLYPEQIYFGFFWNLSAAHSSLWRRSACVCDFMYLNVTIFFSFHFWRLLNDFIFDFFKVFQ